MTTVPPGSPGDRTTSPSTGTATTSRADPGERADASSRPERRAPDLTERPAHDRQGRPAPDRPAPETSVPPARTPTRASGAWTAAVGALVLLLLLAVFVGQNAHGTEITFLGWHGRAPTAVLLLAAAVVGGALVAAAGVARILQLRRRGRAAATGGSPGAA
jgi:uncharacterized integral membrane protein